MTAEVILYYSPDCPYCRRMESILRRILRIGGLHRRVSFSKVCIDRINPYSNPIPRMMREVKEGISLVLEGGVRREKDITEEDIEYAHLSLVRPIVEIRADGQSIYLVGFARLDEKEMRRFIINLATMLRVLSG